MKKPIPAKKTYIYVKPASKKRAGAKEATLLKIRNPLTGTHMPAYGAKVELTTLISRMLLVPKPNRPRAPRLHRGADLVKIDKDEFDRGLADAAKAAEAKAKKVEKTEAKAAKADANATKAAEKAADAPESKGK